SCYPTDQPQHANHKLKIARASRDHCRRLRTFFTTNYPLPTIHSRLNPKPAPHSSPTAGDANSASQYSNRSLRTASRCKSPELPCPHCPQDPFRPCEFPAETL